MHLRSTSMIRTSDGEYTVDVNLQGRAQPWVQAKHTVFRAKKQPCEAYPGTV